MFGAWIEELTMADIGELDAALAIAKRRRDEADAAITAVVDARQHGQRSVQTYLRQHLNCSRGEASRIGKRGRLFNLHPEIGDAFAESRVGVGQVDQLATAFGHPRAGVRFGEFAGLLTDQAERLEYGDFATAVKHFVNQADPDGSFDDQRFHQDHRTASVRVDDGAVTLHASGGDPMRAAEMARVFELAVDAEAHKDFEARRELHGVEASAHPLPRSAEQRRFDAMYEIFVASTTAPANGKRPEPLVNIVIDPTTSLEVLARHGLLELDDADLTEVDPSARRCATSTGVAIHPDVALHALVAGSVRRVVVDAHDVVIDMGRTRRLFTGKARQAAQLLATTCGYRGCDIPARLCDVDHVEPWADGGATDQANAMPLCGPHDRHKHRQRLVGRRDKLGRIHLIRPDGSVIKPLHTRDPDWAEPTSTDRPDALRRYTWDAWVAGHPELIDLPQPPFDVTVTAFPNAL